MSLDESVVVRKTAFTRLQCLMEAIRCDAKDDGAWNNIAASLDKGETITIPGFKGAIGKRECYTHALEASNGGNKLAWKNLALTMESEEAATTGKTTTVTKTKKKKTVDTVTIAGKSYSKKEAAAMAQAKKVAA